MTGYAGTGLNKIFKTINGGLDWGSQTDTGGSNRICILDSMRGWSSWVGNNIGIKRTTNGGGIITYTGLQQISEEVPQNYKLLQNYPNPFNPITNIKYQIVENSYVLLKVYDILGREITTLVNEQQKAGTYLVDWNAESNPSGTFFYRLITYHYTETKKMLLIK